MNFPTKTMSNHINRNKTYTSADNKGVLDIETAKSFGLESCR